MDCSLRGDEGQEVVSLAARVDPFSRSALYSRHNLTRGEGARRVSRV